jgi:hypothetical protein
MLSKLSSDAEEHRKVRAAAHVEHTSTCRSLTERIACLEAELAQARKDWEVQSVAAEASHQQDRDLLLLRADDVEARGLRDVESLRLGWAEAREALDAEKLAHAGTRERMEQGRVVLRGEWESRVSKLQAEFQTTTDRIKAGVETAHADLTQAHEAKLNEMHAAAEERSRAAQLVATRQHTRMERRHRYETAQLELKQERAMIDFKEDLHDRSERKIGEIETAARARSEKWERVAGERNGRIEELLVSLRQERQARTEVEVSLAKLRRSAAVLEGELQVYIYIYIYIYTDSIHVTIFIYVYVHI